MMWVGSGSVAADADFAIGEGNGRKFGWEHWRKAALVRDRALTSFSCLPSALRRETLRPEQPNAHNFPVRFCPHFRVQPLCSRLPIVRSLAHLPEARNIHHAF